MDWCYWLILLSTQYIVGYCIFRAGREHGLTKGYKEGADMVIRLFEEYAKRESKDGK